MKEYVRKLLLAFEKNESRRMKDEGGTKIDPPSLHPSSLTLQPLVDPLTDRELELLRLVAIGRSNQAIARELFLAVGTVKKHLNNIFGKLVVQSRTQAIVRARELKLLE